MSIHCHPILGEGQVCRCRMHAGGARSPRCKENRNSSETRLQAIPESKFVVKRTTEGALVCNVASRIAEAMVAKLAVHALANIIQFGSDSFSGLRALDMDVQSIKAMSVGCLLIAGFRNPLR